MKTLSEIPFISISRENLMAASDMLDKEQKGELLEMIIDAVLNDGYPTSDTKCVNGVFNQFMAVIERQAKGYSRKMAGLDKFNEERRKKKEAETQVSVYTEPTPPQPVEEYDPTFDYCVETLRMIMKEKGDGPMEVEANKYEKMYGFAVKDLCTAVRGH